MQYQQDDWQEISTTNTCKYRIQIPFYKYIEYTDIVPMYMRIYVHRYVYICMYVYMYVYKY